MLLPDGGSGTCLGHDIMREAMLIRREAGYMTQTFSYYDDLTVRENLDLVANVYQMPDPRLSVARIIDRMGLTSRSGRLTGELSSGWKQRLALAACVLHGPKLLLLDEPTAGVDAKARRDFWDLIHDMAGEGLTVLVSTHYMDERKGVTASFILPMAASSSKALPMKSRATPGLSYSRRLAAIWTPRRGNCAARKELKRPRFSGTHCASQARSARRSKRQSGHANTPPFPGRRPSRGSKTFSFIC